MTLVDLSPDVILSSVKRFSVRLNEDGVQAANVLHLFNIRLAQLQIREATFVLYETRITNAHCVHW